MTYEEIMKSEKLKERFCKDCNIPIRIFKEPYFFERLVLYDAFYGTLDKWKLFCNELEDGNYKNEQNYFEEYNRVKEAAMEFIKSSEGYKKFNTVDHSVSRYSFSDIDSKHIYRPSNDGHIFISIDMKQANFSALNYFDSSIFDNKSWENFLRKFTDNEHIINSKYIRQVILGNCNPRRQVNYEKKLMTHVLNDMLLNSELAISKKSIVCSSNDEIIIDATEILDSTMLFKKVKEFCKLILIPLSVNYFKLLKIKGIDGYICEPLNFKGKVQLKCVDSNLLPLVIRKLIDQEITNNDLVFVHDGLLAKWIDVPKIEV